MMSYYTDDIMWQHVVNDICGRRLSYIMQMFFDVICTIVIYDSSSSSLRWNRSCSTALEQFYQIQKEALVLTSKTFRQCVGDSDVCITRVGDIFSVFLRDKRYRRRYLVGDKKCRNRQQTLRHVSSSTFVTNTDVNYAAKVMLQHNIVQWSTEVQPFSKVKLWFTQLLDVDIRKPALFKTKPLFYKNDVSVTVFG